MIFGEIRVGCRRARWEWHNFAATIQRRPLGLRALSCCLTTTVLKCQHMLKMP